MIFFSAVVIENWNSLISLLHWFFPTFFLSGLDRSAFDNKVVSFDEHINSEHNMWHYLYFIVLLKVKDTTEFTGPESYVSLMVKVHHEYGKRFMKWGKGRGGRGRVSMKFERVLGLKLLAEGGMTTIIKPLVATHRKLTYAAFRPCFRNTIWIGSHACVLWAWPLTKEKVSKVKLRIFRKSWKAPQDWYTLCRNNSQI